MNDFTSAQTEAQLQLQTAIENHMRAFRSSETSQMEVTGDWVLVAGVTSLDLSNQDRRYTYHLAFSGGEQPEHIAHGLLHMGTELITSGVRDE
ncbi:MAG: hypothetical protein ABW022_10990 [Actinoplanes sp.]